MQELHSGQERIAELERQLADSKWLRQELNAYHLGYPTSEEEVLEHETVRAMSDADFLASIKAQDFEEKKRDRERIKALTGVLEYLDRQGGLGLDKHAMIRTALAKDPPNE